VLRHLLTLVLGVALASAQPAARVEGHVVSATGEPLAKVALRMMADRGSGVQIGRPPTYDASSGDDGRFAFEDVAPGNYTLAANKAGYVIGRYSPKPGVSVLTVELGQVLKDLVFKLTPQVAITGKVIDQDGDPVAGAEITGYRMEYPNGRGQLARAGPPVNPPSDDQGNFRIVNLTPGRYYLSAQVAAPAGRARATEADVTTYYPGAIDFRDAKVLDATGGGEIHGIDIHLRRERVFSIRGTLVDAASGGPVLNATVIALPADGMIPDMQRVFSSQVNSHDGTFEFRNLSPGPYDLQAMRGPLLRVTSGRGTMACRCLGLEIENTGGMARAKISIAGSDVDGVVLSLAAPAEISGTVKMEGDGPLAKTPAIALLESSGVTLNGPTEQIKDGGAFVIKGLAPSQFLLNVTSLPDGFYVKSAHFGGADVTHAPLDLTGGGGTLEIVLSPKAAEITGTTTPDALVTLWPKIADPGSPTRGSRSAHADQDGKFTLSGLAPGDYYAAAWEDGEPGLMQSPEFVRQFEADGAASVSLEEGGRKSVTVRLISADKIAAALAMITW
jgi:hypothetical protein